MAEHRKIWIPITLLTLCHLAVAQPAPDFAEPRAILTEFQTPNQAVVADVNGDGLLDLFVTAPNDHDLVWLEGTGLSSPEFIAHAITPAEHIGPWGVSAGDIDGDGDIDAAVASVSYDDRVTWFENLGGSSPAFTEHLISQSPDSSFNGARYTAIVDLDGDGDADVVSTNDGPGRVIWHENIASEEIIWKDHILDSNADGAWGITVADLDSDGDPDILVATRDDNQILWYENSGSSTPVFTKRVIASAIDMARSVATADFDGDGDLDAVSTSSYNDTLQWHENLGGTPIGFTTHSVAHGLNFALDAQPADLNGDGAMDIIACSRDDDTVIWCENSGAPSPIFTTHVLSESITSASSVAGADFDGDGDVDIVATAQQGDAVYFFENLSGLVLDGIRFVDFSGDGVVQRGEPGLVEVVVCSMNSAVEAATATLTVDIPTVTLARDSIVFDPPDAGQCVTLRFPFTTAQTADCGTVATFTAMVSWGTHDAVDSASLTLGEGPLMSHILTENAPLPIPDGDLRGLRRMLVIPPTAGVATAVHVEIHAEHSDRGDLLVTLTSPAGQVATLFDGQPEDDLPAEPASFFVPTLEGEEVAGNYTLTIADRALGDTGALMSWTLMVEHQSTTCVPWGSDPLIDVLLGIEAVSPAYDYNRDGMVNAADLVTGQMGPP